MIPGKENAGQSTENKRRSSKREGKVRSGTARTERLQP